ncbi:MAG: MFS transporter [Pseudomonadota bacterium]
MSNLAMTASPVSVEKRLAKRTFLLLLVLSICTALLLTFAAVQRFKQILLPQIMLQTSAIGESVQTAIDRAVSLGIPFESLVGVEDFLDDTLKDNPEIAFLEVKQGQRTYSRGQADQSKEEIIIQDIPHVGSAPAVTVGVRADYLNEKLHVLFGDAAVVLFVALIAGIEIALFFAYQWLIRPFDTWSVMVAGVRSGAIERTLTRRVIGPLAELLQLSNHKISRLRINLGMRLPSNVPEWARPAASDVRIALFLFVLSEELLRSFFPLYVREFVDSSWRFGTQLAISAPMVAYMFFAGAGTWYGSGFIDRIGIRPAFKIAVVATVVSLCGMALASTLYEVILWRSVMAVAYALATIASQVYIARCSAQSSDARGLATFVAAITAACVCGAPVGALLADIFGQKVAMLVAAASAVLAWLTFRNVAEPLNLNPSNDDTTSANTASGQGHFRLLLANSRILILMLCSVVPSKMLLTGMLFFITPLLLKQYGLSQATIGQFFVLFYGILLTGNAFSSRLTSRAQSKAMLIAGGGFVSGAGALLLFWFDAPWALGLAIISFGIGQSLIQTPVTAHALQIVRVELPQISSSKVIALSRVFERGGSILGALLGASLSALFGYGEATAALGCVALVLTCGTFLLLAAPTRRESRYA